MPTWGGVVGVAELDLDVLFWNSGNGYQAQVVSSPAGNGQSVMFARPFNDLELKNLVLEMGQFRVRARRAEAAPVAAAKQAGRRLFEAVFTGAVGECLRRSQDRAQEQNAALRIRLRLADCPELAVLPWELLYDRSDDWFLALSDHTPVVRYMQLPSPPRPVQVTLPLEVLVIRSEPSDFPSLDLQAEWTEVADSLDELRRAGSLAVTELAVATLDELRCTLGQRDFHVLHYMGHGGVSKEGVGVLWFTGQAGAGVPVTGEDLGVMLHDHRSLRLAVVNACEAGRTDPVDAFAGVAETLVRRGIPAVVAMQFEITDQAAAKFAPALYGALAAGHTVDTAVAEARKAIYTVSPLEWATPVLYLRSDNARLFDIAPAAPPVESTMPGQPVRARPESADEAELAGPAPTVATRAAAAADDGDNLYGQLRYAEAGTAYRTAIVLNPQLTRAYSGLGNALLRLCLFDEAEDPFREAIRLEPTNAVAHCNLGYALQGQEHYADAETAFREAIRLEPTNAVAHCNLGYALQGQEHYADAETAFREEIRLEPTNAVAHCNLGYALQGQEHYADAETAFRKAIRLDPTNAVAHHGLGNALQGLERYQEAETAFREAIRLNPSNAVAHANLGKALNCQKRYSEAVPAFQEAIRLDPTNSDARNGLPFAQLRRAWS